MKQIHFIILMIMFLGISTAYSQKKIVINKKSYNVIENKIFLKDYNLMTQLSDSLQMRKEHFNLDMYLNLKEMIAYLFREI